MAKTHKVLINQVDGRFTINFEGSFPNNKFALKKGQKIYLTEEEWDFVQSNLPKIIGNQVTIEGDSPESPRPEQGSGGSDVDSEEFFAQNTNKAKAQIKKMKTNDVEKLITYANENELNNKIVDALVDRSNELNE